MKIFNIALLFTFLGLVVASCSSDTTVTEDPVSQSDTPTDEDSDGEAEDDPDMDGDSNDDMDGNMDDGMGDDTSSTDFMNLPVPVQLDNGMEWEFQDFSDDFEYEAPAGNLGSEFDANWYPRYHNAWLGPGRTEWDPTFPYVTNGMLHIPARKKQGTDKINMGIITNKTRIQYPVYIETRAKLMNSVLANAAWLLSPDDTQEIDFLEAYGASFSESASNPDHSWFAERIHVSHHVFIRQPFTDWQPSDSGAWYRDGTLWREEFHTYGVYWRDPWHLEYYIDGQLVRTVSGRDQIDPVFHTNSVNPGDTSNDTRTGLSKEMDIIIDAEDHEWRSNPQPGFELNTPTDNELANEANNTFLVDWIRIFKPVSSQ